MAQLVEQLIRNQQVAGSSPASSSTFRTAVFISAVLLFKPAGYIRSPVQVRPVAPRFGRLYLFQLSFCLTCWVHQVAIFVYDNYLKKKMFKFYEFMITMANVNILFIVVDNLKSKYILYYRS